MNNIYILLVFITIINSQIYDNQCISNSDCNELGQDYICTSVETRANNLELLSQCVKTPICGGSILGNCPDFSSWPGDYKKVKSECKFSFISGCDINVDCYKNENNDAFGIYKCLDTNTITMLIDLNPKPISNESTNNTEIMTNIPTINNKTTNIPTYGVLTNQPLNANYTASTPAPTTNFTILPKKYSSANHLISNIICIILNFSIIINI